MYLAAPPVDILGCSVMHLMRHPAAADSLVEPDTGHSAAASGYSSVMGMFGSLVGSPAASKPQSREGVFSLGDRGLVLAEDAHALLFRLSADTSAAPKFQPPEAIFRAILILLTATAESECAFATEFLKDLAPLLLPRIFQSATSAIEEWIRMHVEGCYDPVALLLMIRLPPISSVLHRVSCVDLSTSEVWRLALSVFCLNGLLCVSGRARASQDVVCGLEERGIGQVRPLLDRLTLLLWPRFKAVLDRQMQHVRDADAASMISHGSDKYPHFVTRRFAELTACVHLLRNAESGEMLDHSLNFVRNEIEALWGRMAVVIGDARRRQVFTINQLDYVLGIYAQRGVPSEVVAAFGDKLASVIESYVEAELALHMGDMIKFTGQAEAGAAVTASAARPLVDAFAAGWKQSVEMINVSVMGSFNNMKNGMEILKRTLTQMLLYYTRFCEVIKLHCAQDASLPRGLVNIPTIMSEIRKYSRTF